MRIASIEISNYRTLDEIHLQFPAFYSAICGKNNAGKTNILKAIRMLLREQSPFAFGPPERISFKEDFPLWKEKTDDSRIQISLLLNIGKDLDAGLYKFIEKFATVEHERAELSLRVSVSVGPRDEDGTIVVNVDGTSVDDYSSREIHKKIQASAAILFHNSTGDDGSRVFFRQAHGGFLSELSSTDRQSFETIQKRFDSLVQKVAKQHQRDVTELLGKLEDKYVVGLSVPSVNLEHLPFDMALGDKSVSVPLKEWGSGTRNRTQILLTLLKARRLTESASISDKITPVIIIEEPESFLHPSGQAEFGRILQDLAEEFQVQVLATTHSPYMLSMARPESNVLLRRCVKDRKAVHSEVVDTTGDGWMQPFGLALGIDNSEFAPWKDLLFGRTDSILLVEGEIDKEYFEMLRDPKHGKDALIFDGEIFAYGGKDTLKNTILLRFIMNKYERFFITYDLDAKAEVARTLGSLELVESKHYCHVGHDIPGKRDIEGLLPDDIRSAVFAKYPDLVQQAMSSETRERVSAKNSLKKRLLEEFQASAKPGQDHFRHFYHLAKQINKSGVGRAGV